VEDKRGQVKAKVRRKSPTAIVKGVNVSKSFVLKKRGARKRDSVNTPGGEKR